MSRVVMSRQRFVLLVGPVSIALLAFAGCGDSKTDSKTKTSAKTEQAEPEYGPNGGHVFELEAKGGKHVHVEFVGDDKAKKLTAVLLGADAKQEVQSSAAEATLEATTGGEKKPFKLKAEAQDGKASRYSSSEPGILEAVKAKGAKIKFQVELDGKTYAADADHIVH